MAPGTTRRRFIQASAATAAGVALGDAGALAAQAGRPEHPAAGRRLASHRLRRHLRQPHQDPQHRRHRRRRHPLHPRLPRGDAHRPRPQLDPQRPPRLPVPRLARPGRADRPAGLVAPERRPQRPPGTPPWRRLVDRLRHRQPLPRLRAPIRPAPRQRAPLRQDRRAARRRPSRLERPAQGPAPLAPPLHPRRQDRARRPLHGQQPLLGQRGALVRRQGLQERHRRARGGQPQPAVRAHGRHLRAPRALDPAASVRAHVRRPRLARPRAGHAALLAHEQLARARRRGARAAPPARPLLGRDHDDRPLARRADGQAPRSSAARTTP